MGVAAATRVVCLSVLCLCVGVRGFYIPGVAPTEYEEGDKLEIKVRLTVSWDELARKNWRYKNIQNCIRSGFHTRQLTAFA